MYKYKLIKRSNPQDKAAPRKWYATPIGEQAESVKAMTRAATENTTTAPIELAAGLVHLSAYAVTRLMKGEPVSLGDMGDLRITFRSKGVADINKFNPNTMIYEPRQRFVPKKAFRDAIISKLTFENAGVLADGIDYASLAAYRKAKGLSSGGGEEGGGEEELPFG